MTVTADATLHGPPSDAGLTELLRASVRAALATRVSKLRISLPARPTTALARCTWWKSLNPGQARAAALLDHLETLCGHLDGHPALGLNPEDPIPVAALEAAEGFTSAPVAVLIRSYRAARTG
ncbi:hypothetical protein ACFVV7_26515 [Streptomyces globisporus]|uniref:hypothetical protein n=1 Tax=Streptomyces globisporus TaxID=1908 RepID=UPI0036DD9F62